MSESTFVGVPTMCLLPARNFNFSVSQVFSIELPIKGKFKDLDAEFYKDTDLEFCLYDNGTLNITSISKILFSIGKYPDLDDNQLFCPINFITNETTILITGQVVTLLEANTDDTTV